MDSGHLDRPVDGSLGSNPRQSKEF